MNTIQRCLRRVRETHHCPLWMVRFTHPTCYNNMSRIAITFLLVFFFQSTATAQIRIGDINASVQPLPSMSHRSGSYNEGTSHGYVEFRVKLKNNSADERIVHISYPPTQDGVRNAGALITRSVRIAGKQTVSVSLFQPAQQVAQEAVEVSVEGTRDPGIIHVTSPFISSYRGYNDTNRIAVLLGRAVPQEFRDGMRREKTTDAPPKPTTAIVENLGEVYQEMGGRTPMEERFTFLRSELSVGKWSHNWLGYSCYDVIVIDGDEAETMPPQVQLAVRRWLECGGTLFINAKTIPKAFSEGGKEYINKNYLVGFGRVIISGGKGKSGWQETYKLFAAASIPQYCQTDAPDNRDELLVAQTTVPVRGLFVLVLLFGICIGPVNLWLLSKYKRRIWLWWNVPAISLLTCLTVFGYSIASEGWTSHGKTASLTVLDERSHRATTFGYVSFYSPLTPSSGPHFHTDTEVTLLNTEMNYYRRYGSMGSNTLHTVDWTADQHLRSGWVTARVPTYFQIRKNEDRRERLSVEKNADGTLKIVNALGADIRRLCLADSSGRIFETTDIPAGAERTLTADKNKTASNNVDFVPGKISLVSSWLHTFRGINDAWILSDVISPGTYIALLDQSPFIERPLEGATVEDTAAIVYGISKEE